MKIAIYEPEPRVCGPMTCAYHLQTGFQALGHDCDVITFTRSGKPRRHWGVEEIIPYGGRWWNRAPDVTAKYVDAAEVLGGYDAVILSDVRTVLQDKLANHHAAYLDPFAPDYLSVLRLSKRPFTFALHGNNYPPSEVPYATDLVKLPGFTGKAITFSPSSPLTSQHLWPDVTWVASPLPYQLTNPVNAPATKRYPSDFAGVDRSVVGITGRYMPNKGHHLLALAAAHDGFGGANTELWGSASVGAGPSVTYRTYEFLRKDVGLKGDRYGNHQEGWDPIRGGDILRPYEWDVYLRSHAGGAIRYRGAYADALDVCAGLTVHVDLTASSFSDGMEYSQFEAIDAGCTMVSVESMWGKGFNARVVPEIVKMPGETKLWVTLDGHRIVEEVASAVNQALRMTDTDRNATAQWNRTTLKTVHDPADVAVRYFEALGMIREVEIAV